MSEVPLQSSAAEILLPGAKATVEAEAKAAVDADETAARGLQRGPSGHGTYVYIIYLYHTAYDSQKLGRARAHIHSQRARGAKRREGVRHKIRTCTLFTVKI